MTYMMNGVVYKMDDIQNSYYGCDKNSLNHVS